MADYTAHADTDGSAFGPAGFESLQLGPFLLQVLQALRQTNAASDAVADTSKRLVLCPTGRLQRASLLDFRLNRRERVREPFDLPRLAYLLGLKGCRSLEEV